ncbi:MAG: preprotein translocase subunit SecE [Candidatus Cryptobacteroides sp.]
MSKFTNYIKESFVELTKKVSWPTWDKLQNSAVVVMVASLICAVVIFLMDFCFQNLMSFIYTL